MSADQPARSASDGERQPHGPSVVALSAVQFFVGGLVMFVAALILVVETAQNAYDGGSSAIGWSVFALGVAVLSMIAAFVIGLPVRLVPRWRSRWLAHGELTLVGTIVGAVACWLVLATAPVVEVADDLGDYSFRDANAWALLAAWAVFTLSVAHFVWPVRWRRSAR